MNALAFIMAAGASMSYWITKIVFILGGLAFGGAGAFAMKNKDDPNQTITPGKAMAMVIAGAVLLIFGLFFVGRIID
jgi:hypothetical protein